MPTLAELILTLHLRRDEETGEVRTVFSFETVREFRSFRYELAAEAEFSAERRSFLFTISGMAAPPNLMPGAGAARREFSFAGLEGDYRVTLAGARQSASFAFRADNDQIVLTEPPAEDGARVVVEKGVENVRV